MRVLLVDHDSEGLETIARAIRGVLELDCVTSKGDALLLLRQNTYDVLIACERAVDGSGLDLLGRTTRTAVPLKRIFAAAPERLQLLGPRLAPFKVQRTINYPIDLEELWLAIAQVTGGPDDETDGTIERVVLDERGIPSEGTVPRAPIPPRPPAPLSGLPPAPVATAPTPISAALGAGRAAAARAVQPAPEPPLRAPPPPRAPPPIARPAATPTRAPAPPANTSDTGRMRAPTMPANTSDTGRMRALAQPMAPLPPMPMPPPLSASAPAPVANRDLLPGWTPELPPEDDFAQVAAQARLGVQQKTIDESARRKKQRLLTACGVAVVVAGGIVFLIEKFYDPTARAREQAIAATVQQMAEQQKATDDLTLIEIDIENAIMNNDLPAARRELAKLIEKSPEHPRREFLEKSIDRAAELAKLSPQSSPTNGSPANQLGPQQPPTQAAVVAAPTGAQRSSASRTRTQDRVPERTPERVVAKAPERSPPPRSQREASSNSSRSFGAPIGEAPRESVIPLDAPINAPPSTTTRRNDTSFSGRTVEASDGSGMRTPAATPTAAVPNPSMSGAGSAAVALPPAAAPAAAPPAPVDVVPAKVVKRVAPVAPIGVSRKTSGFVVVKFNISESGRVTDVAVVESTPPGVFDDVAQSAVRKWIYEPRKENGVPVASQAKARLVFDAAQ